MATWRGGIHRREEEEGEEVEEEREEVKGGVLLNEARSGVVSFEKEEESAR